MGARTRRYVVRTPKRASRSWTVSAVLSGVAGGATAGATTVRGDSTPASRAGKGSSQNDTGVELGRGASGATGSGVSQEQPQPAPPVSGTGAASQQHASVPQQQTGSASEGGFGPLCHEAAAATTTPSTTARMAFQMGTG